MASHRNHEAATRTPDTLDTKHTAKLHQQRWKRNNSSLLTDERHMTFPDNFIKVKVLKFPACVLDPAVQEQVTHTDPTIRFVWRVITPVPRHFNLSLICV